MSVDDGVLKDHRNFDPEFCRTAVRIGAVVCALIVSIGIVLLSTVDPSATRCPGWVIPGDSVSEPVWIWGLFLISGFWTLIVSYYAVTWRSFAQKISGKIDVAERTWISSNEFNPWGGWHSWKEFNALCARKNNFNSLLVVVMIASAFVAATPLIVLAAKCT